MTQDLWQTHHQVLLIALLKEFIKLRTYNKKCLLKLNTKIMIAFMNTQTLRIFIYYTNVYVAIKITENSF